MFGMVSKKRLKKEIMRIFEEERTDKAWSENNLYYRMGNANALNAIISRLGLGIREEMHTKEDSDAE